MPILLPTLLNFQGSTHLFGVGSFRFLNVGDIRSTFVLNVENEKWYVFKRMNEEYLLCGNENNINDATKIKLLPIAYVVEQNICFEKVV